MKLNIKKIRGTTLGILGTILFLDGLYLILQNKIHLGTILPLLIGLIFLIHALFWQHITNFLSNKPQIKKIWKIIWTVFFIWLLSLLFFFVYIQIQKNKKQESTHIKAILVLGSGLINSKASPSLQARLDKAAEVYVTSPQSIIIVTGGLGYQQNKTEAEVMSSYLQDNFQIPALNIKTEDQSTSTELNLKNSQPILKENRIRLDDSIAIVTSDFHTPRAKVIAEKQGYRNIQTYGSNTPIETRYNAWLREYFAYISGWLFREF